jgi:alkylhydroperoxidase family enzyme
VTLDDELVRLLQDDYEHAPITAADRAMLDYVGQLTVDATRIGPADHERLHTHGFDDRGILQITLIASWFNYINRVADALGVGRE